jgi:hypothetical protein
MNAGKYFFRKALLFPMGLDTVFIVHTLNKKRQSAFQILQLLEIEHVDFAKLQID